MIIQFFSFSLVFLKTRLYRKPFTRRTFSSCVLALALLPASGGICWGDELTQLNASQLVTAMGAGWNLGNQLEATKSSGFPNETAWNNPAITRALVKHIKAAGFDTVRIPVSYLNYIGKAPLYRIESEWLARVKEVVDYAYSEDLYVIINIHGDGYHSVPGGWLFCDAADQVPIRAKYQKVWQQIATTFIEYDQHLTSSR